MQLKKICIYLAAGWLFLGISSAYSQPVYQWTGKEITFGWNNPTFSKDLEYAPITSSAYMNIQWPLGDHHFIRGILPWIHYRRPDNQASLFGNPSFGWQKAAESMTYSLSIVFPVIDDLSGEAAYVESRIKYPNRKKYYHKAWALQGGVSYEKKIYQNFSAVIHGELQSLYYEQLSRVDLFVDYRLELRRDRRQIHYDLSWLGSFMAAGSGGQFGDEWGHLLQLGFGYKTALVNPRLYVGLPLSRELTRDVDYVLGLSVTLDMGKFRWPGSY